MQEAALETIKAFAVLQLRDEDREVFVEARLNPPAPTEAAKRAAARFKVQMGL